MKKIINPMKKRNHNGRQYRVFMSIEFDKGKLSICGVEGTQTNGKCIGNRGQISSTLRKDNPLNDWILCEGWDIAKVEKLLEVWEKWHLNDMHAECEHQEEEGKSWKTHPSEVCEVCGWRLGYGWSFRTVPQDVIDFLMSLPDSEVKPAWV